MQLLHNQQRQIHGIQRETSLNEQHSHDFIAQSVDELRIIAAHLFDKSTWQEHSCKHRLVWFSRTLLVAYLILPFLRQLSNDKVRSCTAVIFELPKAAYSWIEIVLVAALIFMRHYLQLPQKPNGKRKRDKAQIAKLVVSMACLLAITVNSVVIDGISIGLALRVLVLICCSQTFYQMAKVYCNVIYYNLKYFVLMWMSMVLFWAAGDILFSSYDLPNQGNLFQDFFDMVWGLLVLQSTANFPDVSLPFVSKNMMCMLYFVIFLFSNSVIISNVVIASSYNAYKDETEGYELTDGLPKMLMSIMSKKESKRLEIEVVRRLSPVGRALREFVNNSFYRLMQWVLSIVLFLMITYHPTERYADGLVWIILSLTIVLSFQTVVMVFTSTFELLLSNKVILYDMLTMVATIAVSILMLVDDRLNYILPYLALLRLPQIVKPVLQWLFKDELQGLEFTSPKAAGNVLLHSKFTPRLVQVFTTLFLVLLQFSGIGILLYEGLVTDQSRTQLSAAGLNPDYIYLNFNSVPNSFITLFVLLIFNNWNMVVASFVALTGSRYTRLYFIMFYMFGVLVAYTIVVTCIIECVITLAERKKEHTAGIRKSHSAKIKERLVRMMKDNMTERTTQINDSVLLDCIDREIEEIRQAQYQV